MLVGVTITADSAQEAEKMARRARDVLKTAIANDCKVSQAQFTTPRIIKTYLIRKLATYKPPTAAEREDGHG